MLIPVEELLSYAELSLVQALILSHLPTPKRVLACSPLAELFSGRKDWRLMVERRMRLVSCEGRSLW